MMRIMTEEKKEVDINEAFENLLFAEEIAQDSGYTEGFDIGKRQLLNGYHLGYHRGSLLAAQLGYCCGVLEQYLSTEENTSKKSVVVARDVLQDIYDFPRCNDHNVDILKLVETIKLKYTKFCALAKISSAYPEADKLNF